MTQSQFIPAGMRAPDAARFVGVSETKFREWVTKGHMPQPYQQDDCVIWDSDELRNALRSLPRRGQPANDDWAGAAL